MTGVCKVMAKFFVTFCCVFSLFQIVLSSVDRVIGRLQELTLQSVGSAAADNCGEMTKNHGPKDYKAFMGFALGVKKQYGYVKINVHGELIPLPTISSKDSPTEKLEKILKLDSTWSGSKCIKRFEIFYSDEDAKASDFL